MGAGQLSYKLIALSETIFHREKLLDAMYTVKVEELFQNRKNFLLLINDYYE